MNTNWENSDLEMSGAGVLKKHLSWGNVTMEMRFEVSLKDRGGLPLVKRKGEDISNVGITWSRTHK